MGNLTIIYNRLLLAYKKNNVSGIRFIKNRPKYNALLRKKKYVVSGDEILFVP